MACLVFQKLKGAREGDAEGVGEGVYLAHGVIDDALEAAQRMDAGSRRRPPPTARRETAAAKREVEWEMVALCQRMHKSRMAKGQLWMANVAQHCSERVARRWVVRMAEDSEALMAAAALGTVSELTKSAQEKGRRVLLCGVPSLDPIEGAHNAMLAARAAAVLGGGSGQPAVASSYMAWKAAAAPELFTVAVALRSREERWLASGKRAGGASVERRMGVRSSSEVVSCVIPLPQFAPIDLVRQPFICVPPRRHSVTEERREICYCVVLVSQGSREAGQQLQYVSALQNALWIARRRRWPGCRPAVRLLTAAMCTAVMAGRMPADSCWQGSLAALADRRDVRGLLEMVEARHAPALPPAEPSREIVWPSVEYDVAELLADLLSTRRYRWDPAKHWLLPQCMRAGILCMLACNRMRRACLLASLPLEVLFMVFTEYVCCSSALLMDQPRLLLHHRALATSDGRDMH